MHCRLEREETVGIDLFIDSDPTGLDFVRETLKILRQL